MKKQPPRAVNRMPITQARINLGQLAKRVHLNGEYFILEKDGIPIVGIMGADELEDYLEVRDHAVNEQIRQSNADIAAGRVVSAKDVLAEIRIQTSKGSKSKKTA